MTKNECTELAVKRMCFSLSKKIEYLYYFGGFSAQKNLAANSAIGYGLGLWLVYINLHQSFAPKLYFIAGVRTYAAK